MTKSITVMSLQGAKEANLEDFDAVISIEDPDQEDGLRCTQGGARQLILLFHDLEKTVQGVRCPKAADVVAALDFVKETGASNILVHCNGGISRSPAFALAFHVELLGRGHEEEALKATKVSAGSWIDPNRLIVGYVDQRFHCQGKLIRCVRETYDGLQ